MSVHIIRRVSEAVGVLGFMSMMFVGLATFAWGDLFFAMFVVANLVGGSFYVWRTSKLKIRAQYHWIFYGAKDSWPMRKRISVGLRLFATGLLMAVLWPGELCRQTEASLMRRRKE